MSLLTLTRRGFLKGACMASGALLMGLHAAGKAYAGIKAVTDYMNDRINSVYNADHHFTRRGSQDNHQVQQLYQRWLEKPLSHEAEAHLHTHWYSKAESVQKLRSSGLYPNPRQKEFLGAPYPHDEA